MGDVGDAFKVMSHERRRIRRGRRDNAPARLFRHEISFESRNNGSHLIVVGPLGLIDFWPGTGLSIHRNNGERYQGIDAVIVCCKGEIDDESRKEEDE